MKEVRLILIMVIRMMIIMMIIMTIIMTIKVIIIENGCSKGAAASSVSRLPGLAGLHTNGSSRPQAVQINHTAVAMYDDTPSFTDFAPIKWWGGRATLAGNRYRFRASCMSSVPQIGRHCWFLAEYTRECSGTSPTAVYRKSRTYPTDSVRHHVSI